MKDQHKGSIEDMLNAFESRIDDLSYDDIETAINISDEHDNYLSRLADHVCDKMLNHFGYYVECDNIDENNDRMVFSVYDDESATNIILISNVDTYDLYRREDKMSSDISDICNQIWSDIMIYMDER